VQYPKRLKREDLKTEILTPELMQKIFEAYTLGLLSREGILPAMKKAISDGAFSAEMLETVCTEEELTSVIKSAHSELQKINLRHPEKKDKVLIGLIMKKVRGRISSSQILKSLRSTYKSEGIDVI
jgi:Glu-tRNA(Gln) amidotransferase subunit E-like FAD-binding protein